jgi:hypothetical protein
MFYGIIRATGDEEDMAITNKAVVFRTNVRSQRRSWLHSSTIFRP